MTEVQTINKFNSMVRVLMNEIIKKYSDDPILSYSQKRINLAINELPTYIIDIMGNFLFEHRTKIIDEDIDFFTQSDFAEDIKKSVNVDDTKYVINKMRQHISTLNHDDIQSYWEVFQDLLALYVSYKKTIRK